MCRHRGRPEPHGRQLNSHGGPTAGEWVPGSAAAAPAWHVVVSMQSSTSPGCPAAKAFNQQFIAYGPIDHSRAVHHFYATGTGRHQRGQPARFLQSQPGKSWQMLRVHVGGDRLDHVLGGFAGRALHHDKQTGLVSCARKRMPGTEALPGIPPLLRVIARAPVTKRPWTIARRPTVYFPLMANRLPRTQRRSVPE